MAVTENKYPTIFVHGFMGWGEDNKKNRYFNYWGPRSAPLPEVLREEGFEVYFPTLGPQYSVWERACDLYAYIFGGQTDAGKIHSAVHKHMRHSVQFPGAVPDLGKTPEHGKINLVGVGFGAQVVRLFASLMADGSQAERNGTKPDDLSPLFEGGHENLIHSVTAIAGTNNGTLLADLVQPITERIPKYAATHRTKQFPVGSLFDTKGWETSLAGARFVNEDLDMDPSIYYFLHRSCVTGLPKEGEEGVSIRLGTRPLAALSAAVLGSVVPGRSKQEGADSSWLQGDGLVSVCGQDVPSGEPVTDTELSQETYRTGVWNRMPTVWLDHLFWTGHSGHKHRWKAYYINMLKTFSRLPDGTN